MVQAFQVSVTVQVTEEVSVQASSPEEAVQKAIDFIDSTRHHDLLVDAEICGRI